MRGLGLIILISLCINIFVQQPILHAQVPTPSQQRRTSPVIAERNKITALMDEGDEKSAEALCDLMQRYADQIQRLSKMPNDNAAAARAYYVMLMDAQYAARQMDSHIAQSVFAKRLPRMKGEAKISLLYALQLTGSEMPTALKRDFAKALKSKRDFRLQVAVIECLGRNKNDELLKEMHALFRDKRMRAAVGVALCRSLVKINAANDSIPVLIDRLEKEDDSKGRIRFELVAALRMLTGKENYFVTSSFQQWWQKNKDTFKPRDMDEAEWLFNQEVDLGDIDEEEMTYYDIPIRAKNIVFIVDESGSMGSRSSVKIQKGSDPDDAVEGTNLDLAKMTLSKILDQLPSDYSFNIIFYSTGFEVFSPKVGMVRASKKNISMAKRFIATRKQNGGTQTMAAMEVVLLNLATKADVGTVFLLSDGMPMSMLDTSAPPLAAAEVMKSTYNVDQVLLKTYLNQTLNIRFNTIGIGSGMASYLEGIAEMNDGQYKQVE